jgi:hypothetical protein
MKTHSVNYISVSQIIPSDWNHWFWDMLSESSDITYGNCTTSFTLIGVNRFIEEVEEILDLVEEDRLVTDEQIGDLKKVFAELSQKEVYIDLES